VGVLQKKGAVASFALSVDSLVDPKEIHDGVMEQSVTDDACFATSLRSLLELSSLRSSRSRSTRVNHRVRRKGTSQVKLVKFVDDLELRRAGLAAVLSLEA